MGCQSGYNKEGFNSKAIAESHEAYPMSFRDAYTGVKAWEIGDTSKRLRRITTMLYIRGVCLSKGSDANGQ